MSFNAELYIHEMDRKALIALESFPAFVKLQKLYQENYSEKKQRIELLSSAIRLSEQQKPEIYNMLPPICETLGIDVPELYLVQSKEINAWTYGTTNPYIVLTTKLIEKVPLEYVSSVLAHECGHIACKHSLYHNLAIQVMRYIELGINITPLSNIPGEHLLISKVMKPLLFWFRCSELSADRAAVLCDGDAKKTVETLLRVHEYDESINTEEFIRQAFDLRDFTNEAIPNKALEEMIISGESHPRLATRAYECYQWFKSDRYSAILNGSYTLEEKAQEKPAVLEEEVVVANVSLEIPEQPEAPCDERAAALAYIDAALEHVNDKLDRYTVNTDKVDYAAAVFSGILAGAIDSMFIGEMKINKGSIDLSHEQVNRFIQEYAKKRGFENDRLKDAIVDLEGAFKVAQDNVWKGANIGVSAKNHHLADLAHHPTPLGLASAIIVQFLRVGTFVNKEGEWHFKLVETSIDDIISVAVPALATGVLNWLVSIAEKKYEDDTDEEISPVVHRLVHLVSSAPIIIEIAKCADNWFGHLVSDMGGSKSTPGGGMGVPGILLSMFYEIAALPGLKETGLPAYINDLYEKQKLNLRYEIPLYKELGRQAIPVILNEVYVRILAFVSGLGEEVAINNATGRDKINWKRIIPINNRRADRMLMIANMTFTVADTADAAVRSAIESGANWVLFAGGFVRRFNYVGAGRAALSIVKEVSNERKEAQLIHERLILMNSKTTVMLDILQDYKEKLDERVSNYLAEDITEFIEGFEYINQGLATGDSNLVIKGNVTIQKVLGREPQFTTQEEFDELMESDEALKL